MINKDEVLTGYQRLADKISEKYMDMTIRQFEQLKCHLEDGWKIVNPRQKERRK